MHYHTINCGVSFWGWCQIFLETMVIDVVISERPQTNHSFRPNATFCLYRHPRFGDIPALRSCRALAAGAEVTVNYEYGFDSAPPWYKQLQVDTILEAYNNTRY